MWVVAFVLVALGAVLLAAFLGVLDQHEAERRRWTSSVPTITSLPRHDLPRASISTKTPRTAAQHVARRRAR